MNAPYKRPNNFDLLCMVLGLKYVCKKHYQQTILRTHLTTVSQNFLWVSKTVHTLIYFLSLHPPSESGYNMCGWPQNALVQRKVVV